MAKKTEAPKAPRVQSLRARTGPIDPRKLDEERKHAEDYLAQVTEEEMELAEMHGKALRRLRLIEAMQSVPPLNLQGEDIGATKED